jgi:hypothetical protein
VQVYCNPAFEGFPSKIPLRNRIKDERFLRQIPGATPKLNHLWRDGQDGRAETSEYFVSMREAAANWRYDSYPDQSRAKTLKRILVPAYQPMRMQARVSVAARRQQHDALSVRLSPAQCRGCRFRLVASLTTL